MGRRKRKELNHFVCPYIKHYKQASLCQKVCETYFTMIEDDMVIKCHVIAEVSKMFKMPWNTLIKWDEKWEINEFYEPSDTSIHGKFHKILADAQEQATYNYIYTNYISKKKKKKKKKFNFLFLKNFFIL